MRERRSRSTAMVTREDVGGGVCKECKSGTKHTLFSTLSLDHETFKNLAQTPVAHPFGPEVHFVPRKPLHPSPRRPAAGRGAEISPGYFAISNINGYR